MSTALTGSTSEPNARNSSTSMTPTHDEPHPGQVRADGVEQVDGVGRQTADEGRAVRRARLARICSTMSCDCLGLAVALPRRPQQRGAALLGDRVDGEHAGHLERPPAEYARTVGRRGVLHAAGWPSTSPARTRVELVGCHVRRSVRREHPVVDASPDHVEERRGDEQQHRRGRRRGTSPGRRITLCARRAQAPVARCRPRRRPRGGSATVQERHPAGVDATAERGAGWPAGRSVRRPSRRRQRPCRRTPST